MSDPQVKSKPMWTRCPGCKDRIFNDKIDIAVHRGHCPADLMLRLQKIERRFDELRDTVSGLGEQVTAEPALDPDDVAPWEEVEVDGITAHDQPSDDGDEVVSVSPSTYFQDEEDEVGPYPGTVR